MPPVPVRVQKDHYGCIPVIAPGIRRPDVRCHPGLGFRARQLLPKGMAKPPDEGFIFFHLLRENTYFLPKRFDRLINRAVFCNFSEPTLNPFIMKKILISLLILVFTLGLSAQERDSLLLEEVEKLKKELIVLKKKNKHLHAKIHKLQKAHEKDLQEAEAKFASTDEALERNSAGLDKQAAALESSEEKTLESLTVLGEWTKKVIMILAIITLVLLILLLILVISNRQATRKGLQELEAKVDSTKDAIEREIKDVLTRHEEDIAALKTSVEKGGK
jgi:hypothetical protein